jgi:redox-sensitive bicupin YhaK (pirin superfamily)
VRFVQMWVVPDERNLAPGYEQLDIADQLGRGGLVTVASGMSKHANDRAISISQRDAALYAARLESGGSVQLPAAPFVHLYVAKGGVDLEGAGRLERGDAVRITASDGARATATAASEILVWEMTSGAGA